MRSHWPPIAGPLDASGATGGSIAEGLRRLGTWESREHRTIVHDDPEQRLVGDDGAQIAHIALVYSKLPDLNLDFGALGVTVEMAAASLGHYRSVFNLTMTGLQDIRALLTHPAQRHDPTPSRRVRDEVMKGRAAEGPRIVFDRLVRDVATYVARNDIRERVRNFVDESLLRLCSRDDVAAVVVNAHSQGTVVAYDALGQLPLAVAGKVRAFVTMGSPLRKYGPLFSWGRAVGCLDAMGAPRTWTNFWDERDPLADPLQPGPKWRRGDKLPQPAGQEVLFRALNVESDTLTPFPPVDKKV